MDVQKFKILVGCLFGGAIFLIICCCSIVCMRKQKETEPITHEDDDYDLPIKNRRRQKNTDVEKQEEAVSLYERDKYRRKYTEAPKPPPPDF